MPRSVASLAYQNMWANDKNPKFLSLSRRDAKESHPRILNAQTDFLEIVLIVSGDVKYTIDAKEYIAKSGDILVFNAGAHHDEFFDPNMQVVSYSLALNQINEENLPLNSLIPKGVSPIKESADNFDVLYGMYQLLWDQQAVEGEIQARLTHYLVQSIYLLVRQIFMKADIINETTIDMPLAVRLKHYLDEHFTEDLSLHILSQKFNISPYYLSHVFKRHFNYSPLQYILRRRIGYAQTLLITTDLSIGEISAKVGYRNPSHFNLLFTKNVGIAPRRYRMNYIS